MSDDIGKILSELKQKTVLVIGNGFDLACNFKTSYSNFIFFIEKMLEIDNVEMFLNDSDIKSYGELDVDEVLSFREFLLDLKSRKNYFLTYFLNYHCKTLSWADFEEELEKIVCAFDLLCSLLSNHRYKDYYGSEFILETNNISVLYKAFVYNPDNSFIKFAEVPGNPEDTSVYLVEQEHIENTESKITNFVKQIPDELYRDLYDFSGLFSSYLELLQANNLDDEIKKKFPSSVDIIINYNYTDIVNKFRSNFISKYIEVIYLNGHVDLKTRKNNIIFGIDQKSSFDFPKFYQFCKKQMRISKSTDYKLIYNLPEIKNLYVFGHSLTLSDADSIRKIFDRVVNDGKINIYYFDGYKETVEMECNKGTIASNFNQIFADEFDEINAKTTFIKSSEFFQ